MKFFGKRKIEAVPGVWVKHEVIEHKDGITVLKAEKPTRPLSQDERLLKLFRERGRTGIRNHEFSSFGILRYSARIDDLRKDGYSIPEPTRLQLPNGRWTNTYIYHLDEFDD